MDGGTWQAAVHGVAKSQTRLSEATIPYTGTWSHDELAFPPKWYFFHSVHEHPMQPVFHRTYFEKCFANIQITPATAREAEGAACMHATCRTPQAQRETAEEKQRAWEEKQRSPETARSISASVTLKIRVDICEGLMGAGQATTSSATE